MVNCQLSLLYRDFLIIHPIKNNITSYLEQLVYAWRNCDERLLRVLYTLIYIIGAQHSCNGRGKWNLLKSYMSHGYLTSSLREAQ